MSSGRFETEVPAITEWVLSDIGMERERQFVKWGPQHHADGTGDDKRLAPFPQEGAYLFASWREHLRDNCDFEAKHGQVRWSDILLEEVFEALSESDQAALRKELVQVAAVAAAWIEDIDSQRIFAPLVDAESDQFFDLGGEG
jgi:hypothetical protein